MAGKFIVITSINYPTEAIKKFSAIEGWQVIVVADLKTPQDWQLENVKLLTVDEQKSLPFETVKLLPWNHYARKNIGYLYAIMHGADLLYETDDDNIPYSSWPEFYPPALKTETYVNREQRFFNIYSYFCNAHVWPRGFPLTAINNQAAEMNLVTKHVSAPVQQGLADLDPDVDAIYRLTIGKQVKFAERSPLFLAPGSYCPFNSQNTLWYHEAFQYMFLPAYVFSRVTDILRGYLAQHFLHQKGQGVLFCNSSVYQERNYHNLLKDFGEEIELYTRTEELITLLEEYSKKSGEFAGIMKYLLVHNFVKQEDVALFEAWLHDLERLGVSLS
ncbi:STELLO glycosyltransferase family protein [Lyngbya aestuarii]|uniref:STELLO glycosyltransferase family protein n=1 Tax=Lyngbya aestuarii TaxID=118322 RepID=UPI00403D930D